MTKQTLLIFNMLFISPYFCDKLDCSQQNGWANGQLAPFLLFYECSRSCQLNWERIYPFPCPCTVTSVSRDYAASQRQKQDKSQRCFIKGYIIISGHLFICSTDTFSYTLSTQEQLSTPTFESKLSSAFTACPSCTIISTTLVFSVSEVMSKCTRMTPCKMEYSEAMSEWPLTSVMNRSRARLLHWFPKMMDCAEGRIPTISNSWAWNKRLQLVLLSKNVGYCSGQWCLSWYTDLERLGQEVSRQLSQAAACNNCCVAKVNEKNLQNTGWHYSQLYAVS